MFRNFLKTALRNLWKNKFYSFINIIGLAAGLATCILIFLYVLDELSFDKYNKNEDRIYRVNTGKLFISFAILAILIASLGLFRLITFAAEQLVKEIGVRKVMGASVTNIAGMLSRDFLKLVLISSFIAFPIAWWSMHKWLTDFAYRVSIGWWVFVIAGAIALTIALVSVIFQAVKAGLANPVKSLRSE